jgi:hypothetical protein
MTDLEAANRALVMIGVEPIGSLSDRNKTARVISGLLPITKKVVLNEFPWNYALRIEPLVPKSGATVKGYSHVFQRPADALSVQRVYSDNGFSGTGDYRIVGDSIGANIESGSVEYVAWVENLEDWPTHVQECLVTRLASDAAISLTGNGNLMQALLNKYMTLASHAAELSVTEENIANMRKAEYSRPNYVEARQ